MESAVRSCESPFLATTHSEILAGYGVKVNLRAAPAAGVLLPVAIEGVPVRGDVVGAIGKLDADD